VVLGLPGHQGFLRQLAIPAEDPSLLRRLIEFDLERHLPLPVEKLYFDFALLGRRRGTMWSLLLAASPKQTVEAAVEQLLGGGIRPTAATLAPVAIASLAAMAGAPPGPGLTVEKAEGVLRGEVLEVGRSLWQHERPVSGEGEREWTEALRALGEEARRASPLAWVLWLGEGAREPVEAWTRQAGLTFLNPFAPLRGASAQADFSYAAAAALALQGLGLGAWRLNLLSPTVFPSRRTVQMRIAAGAALLLVIFGAAGWLNAYRLERRALAKNLAKIQRLAPEVQAVEADARRIAEIRRLIEGLDGTRREPSKLVLLRELTLLVPRHTWLTRITYKRGEIEIAGYSSSSQEVVPRLEGSPLFRQASFAGSVEREGSQERFTIRARTR
jgi:general secretion pathway protein L